MKHASTLSFLFLLAAACGDSKPKEAPTHATTPAPPVEVASKPAEPVATPPVQTEAKSEEASSKWLGAVDAPPTTASEEPKKPADAHETPPVEEKKPAETKKSTESHAKTADAPAAAAPAKVEELSVQVLQEGSGPVVKRGDTVTLEYTISYMPKPAAEKKDEKKKDGKSAKKPDAKKSDEKKSDEKKDEKKAEDAKPKDEPKDADKPAEEKKEAAAAKDEHHEEGEKNGEKAADKPADKNGDKPAEKSDKAADKAGEKADEKHADAKPAEPLKPVIVASTKSFTTPFTVKLTENGKPKLMPGLVRGVEGLKVGTRARILVPAALAYGKDGSKSAGIPPETPVEIEVLVKDARE